MALHWFLVASTFILFLIGAGLFSKSVGFFEYYVSRKLDVPSIESLVCLCLAAILLGRGRRCCRER